MSFLAPMIIILCSAQERPLSESDVAHLGFFRDAVLSRLYNDFPGSIDGHVWPPGTSAVTMAGQRRLDNAVALLGQALAEGTPGSFIETGVWRGGLSFLAAKQLELQNSSRIVYACDSFHGIPKSKRPSTLQDASAHALHILNDNSVDRVRGAARRFHVDADRIRFVEGYFDTSLPLLMKQNSDLRFAVVRLDGDTYESTISAITELYPRLSPGGFIIVDDYTDWLGCRKAIHDYRDTHGIMDDIFLVAHGPREKTYGVYWRKAGGAQATKPMCPGDFAVHPFGAVNPQKTRLVAKKGQLIKTPAGASFVNLPDQPAGADIYWCT